MINTKKNIKKLKTLFSNKYIKILLGILLFFATDFVSFLIENKLEIEPYYAIAPANIARYVTFIYISVMTLYSYFKVIKSEYTTHKAPKSAILADFVYFFSKNDNTNNSRNKRLFFVNTLIYTLYYLSLWSFCVFIFLMDVRNSGKNNPYIERVLLFSLFTITIAFFSTIINILISLFISPSTSKKQKQNTLPSPMAFDINIFKARRKFRYLLMKLIFIVPALFVGMHVLNFLTDFSILPYEKSTVLVSVAVLILFFGLILIFPMIYASIISEKNKFEGQEIFLEPSLIVRQTQHIGNKNSRYYRKNIIEYNVVSLNSYNITSKYIYIYGMINEYTNTGQYIRTIDNIKIQRSFNNEDVLLNFLARNHMIL